MLSPVNARRFKRYAWRLAAIAVLTLLAMLHALGVMRIGMLDQLEHGLYDARLTLNLPAKPVRDERIVIVQIDERSLDALGQWPWRRDMVARLIGELHDRQHTAAIGIDATFAKSPPQPLRADAWQNDQLAAELAHSGAVIGYYFASDHRGHRAGQLPAPIAPLPRPAPRGLLPWDGYGANLPVLMQASARAGFFNVTQDSDGQVRAAPLIAAFDDGLYESLALAVLRQALAEQGQEPAVRLRMDERRVTGIDLVDAKGSTLLSAPLDARGTARVPFRAPGGEAGSVFRYISAVDVYEGWLPEGSLTGRIVLIGSTAPGLADSRATPVSEAYPGVEIHASLIAGMLDGRIPVQPAWTPVALALLLAAIGALMALSLLTWRMPGRLAFGVALFAALAGVNEGLYRIAHLALPIAPALALVTAIVLVNMTLGYWLEARAQRGLARQFAAYVPPELVLQMQSDPVHFTMRARAEEVTVLFCDLRNFTSLAEGMDPLQVQALLNDVLSRLTQAVQAHHGTIDKYIGDCVMAFWGAPLHTPDHATLAVRAALAMRDVMAQIARERVAAGLPPVTAGIGVNTGTVAVGDMGSTARRVYTVIGDAVNLASRLLRLTPVYDVDLIVGETTHAQARDWVWQELDRVRVRGRHQATSIYTPRAAASDCCAALGTELAIWQAALDDWRAQRLTACQQKIARLRALAPNSSLYRLYAERLESSPLAHPPAATADPAPPMPSSPIGKAG